MSATSFTPLDLCGCDPRPEAPPAIDNPPGLDALAYRIGEHPEFVRRMLRALPGTLGELTTRAADDPSIALLDAFAAVADVLAFYQERIANEGFLRTATERGSILQLARAIGYELGPGVAASTWLAFTVEDRAVAADEPVRVRATATVPAGTRVQSVPSGGGLPQTFETGDDLLAEGDLNELFLRATRPQAVATTSTQVLVAGPTTTVVAGDLLLIAEGVEGGPVTGTPAVKTVVRVVPEPEHDRVRLDLADQPQPPPVVSTGPLDHGQVVLDQVPFHQQSVQAQILGQQWSGATLTAFMTVQQWSIPAMLSFLWAPPGPPAPDLPPASPGIYAFGARAAIFGNAAVDWRTLPGPMTTDAGAPYGDDWDDPDTEVTLYTDSQGGSQREAPDAPAVRLDTTYRAILHDSWAVLDSPTREPVACRVSSVGDWSVADFAMSGKVTRLGLAQTDGTTALDVAGFGFRETEVHAVSQRLALAEVPIPDPLAAGTTALELDRTILSLAAGRAVALTGERHDLPGVAATEVVELTDVTHVAGRTTLHFAEPGLANPYVRRTVRLTANVVAATHGETIAREVLGSGSATAHQRFALRKPPLTHVPAPTPTGGASTLEVRVDGVRWREVDSLHELGPADEAFVTRREDDGQTAVIGGDGRFGARFPTGAENVVATYRSGIGADGLVAEDALTLLAVRPPGIGAVTNVLPGVGAQDPEGRDDARRNAPLTVLTLDRVVSLTDYEDFGRAFSGVAKARAVALWRGERQLVHLTLAGIAGADLPDTPGATLDNLTRALAAVRDAGRELRLASYVRVPFAVTGDVLVDARHEPAVVVEAVRAALARAFSFDRRDFGQAVALAEVVSVMMGVTGVIDAKVSALHKLSEAVSREEVLAADLARWREDAVDEVAPAQLLALTPAGATIAARGQA